jgi:8-oxo-dGTP diphosphatase
VSPIAVAVVTSGRRVLLVRRRIAEGSLSWQFPAGEIKAGEGPLEAARRETLEEAGLEATVVGVLGEREHPFTGRWMIYVACEAAEPEKARVGDLEELAELAWCSWPQVRERIPSGVFEPVAAHLAWVWSRPNR